MIGPGVLHNFRFTFEKFSNIESHEHSQVVGVLYEMPRSNLARLDRSEAFHRNYTRIIVEVHHDHKIYHAQTYIMEADANPGDMPTAKYLKLVRQGYKQHNLSQAQIDQALEQKAKAKNS